MRRTILFLTGMLWVLSAGLASAQRSVEKILPLDAEIAANGRSIELSWFDAEPQRVGSVTVKRRLYNQLGGQSWQTIASGLGPVMRYRDETINPGTAYEYQVVRTARDIVDLGYWVVGRDLPAVPRRGTAYVIVDETIKAAIGPRLDRFERDLTGDGWKVLRHSTPRGDARAPVQNLQDAIALREWLRDRYLEDPFGRHTVVLVGHVPLVYSGRINPDGHAMVPHPTDLFYADIDGRWTATVKGEVLDNSLPGDFIEMQVGRIDFFPSSQKDLDTEIRLIRAYFDKNHHWRMGYLGDPREAYGQNPHLRVERFALRNIVGPDKITSGGHHDVGEEKQWLWGVDFGDYNGSNYAEEYTNKAVFTINFGSAKQQIGTLRNPMTALLAQPWYPLSVGWGARPAWWLHHMALGGTIGDVHMRTVNNGEAAKPYRETMDYFPTGSYLWRNPIWVNLLGDPTLSAFPLAPPGAVTLQPGAGSIALSWSPSPDPDTLGYRVFRALPQSKTFTALAGSELLTGTSFTDTAPVDGARYMVRAYGLKNVYAGSFYTFSQGAYVMDASAGSLTGEISLRTNTDQDIRMPEVFNQVTDGKIRAFVEGPAQGRLEQDDLGWVYSPPAAFTGTTELRFSVSDSQHTEIGVLTITVGE